MGTVRHVGIDAVVVRVHDDVKASDLVGAGARLRNDHAVFLHRVLRQGGCARR